MESFCSQCLPHYFPAQATFRIDFSNKQIKNSRFGRFGRMFFWILNSGSGSRVSKIKDAQLRAARMRLNHSNLARTWWESLEWQTLPWFLLRRSFAETMPESPMSHLCCMYEMKSCMSFQAPQLVFLRFVWHSRNCFQQSPVLGIKFFKNWKTESLEKWFMTLSKTLQEIREIEIDCPGDVFASRKSQEIRLSNPSQDPKH